MTTNKRHNLNLGMTGKVVLRLDNGAQAAALKIALQRKVIGYQADYYSDSYQRFVRLSSLRKLVASKPQGMVADDYADLKKQAYAIAEKAGIRLLGKL